ncbi:hypothetical protein [Segniliparus rugosus]|uniref:hypothetical protein n=1 Tax=Segniliparus rugosus TaxID=286804 RepID=UPI0012EBBA67|nr:hypothetical protein [Segniliparus rugosus]
MSTSSRLLPRDDLGVRADLVLGVPSGMVFAWVFEEAVDREDLARIHGVLREGPLSRAVKRSWVPGARDRWVKAPVAGELAYAAGQIPEEQVFGWIEAQDKAPLDLVRGPAWRLSATAVEGGGMVVVLVCHHAVADGLGVFAAWTAAVEGRRIGELPEDGGFVADVVDSFRQWGAALASFGSMLRAAFRRGRGTRRSKPGRSRRRRTTSTSRCRRRRSSRAARSCRFRASSSARPLPSGAAPRTACSSASRRVSSFPPA